MRQTLIFNYFAFGNNFRLLSSIEAGARMRGTQDSLESLLEGFLNACEELDLDVTKQAAAPLTRSLALVKQAEQDSVVPPDLAARVQKACANVDVTLDSELRLRSAFVVTPKRFGVDVLLGDPSSLMAKGVFDSLPELCQYDISEACKCVAFERPTAAAFHLMRAVEGMLRSYYLQKVKRNRVKRIMWNDLITDLRKRPRIAAQPVLDHLDNIRSNFRNPTQHPDARYSVDESQDLLSVSLEAINRMARDLAGDPAASGSAKRPSRRP